MKFFKKSLGQNFLIDLNVIKKIVSLVEIENKEVIEIGPGKGALTDEILKKKPNFLRIIEKDNKLVKVLEKKYSENKNVKIYNDDILKFDLEKVCKKNTIIFGNLPYNISSQILIKILKFNSWPPKISNLIFMFQKELGEKIIGKFKSNNYGRISIISYFRLKVMSKFIVSKNSFFPKPKVTSIVIHFQPHRNKDFKIKKISNLEKITSLFFSKKRKMINKTIKKILSKEKIAKIPKLKTSLRPSDLPPEFYFKVTELFEKR